MNDVLIAFGLTLFAGLATGIGSVMAFMSKKTSPGFLAGALGFSAGVMIYVSMIEIFVKANDSLGASLGSRYGYFVTTISFFGGIAMIALIDALVPEYENPHEMRGVDELPCGQMKPAEPQPPDQESLKRMGFFSALAIAIHNFPEGLATFTAALQEPALGLSIAVAIAIHNIPEGIAVSVPLYYATGSKKKAFGWSFLSGLSEPVGALVGYFLLMRYFNDLMFGILFAGVAGIMVYISLDELLPTAEKYGKHHIAIFGVISGMIVMALSLMLFA